MFNGIIISNSSRQVTIKIPSEDNFIGTYNTTTDQNGNSLHGVATKVTLTFVSSVTNLIQNFGKTDIGPYNLSLTQPSANVLNYENIIEITRNSPGSIILEKDNIYTLFKDGATNIPTITNVEVQTSANGSITKANTNMLSITNHNVISSTFIQTSI